MQLFGSYTSPFVRHCRIAVIESGLNVDFIETDAAASAVQSPTKRVPFLKDGNVSLTDSSSIVRYLREKSGAQFLPGVEDYDQYCLVNTALDTCVNLFMLERDGVKAETIPYLQRQQARVTSTLQELDQLMLPASRPYNDMHLRLACLLAWGLYRQRFSLDATPNLAGFLAGIASYEPFTRTAPPPL